MATTPYEATFCRCKSTECMNKYPGLSDSSICVNTLSDGSCPLGYASCGTLLHISMRSFWLNMATDMEMLIHMQ